MGSKLAAGRVNELYENEIPGLRTLYEDARLRVFSCWLSAGTREQDSRGVPQVTLGQSAVTGLLSSKGS